MIIMMGDLQEPKLIGGTDSRNMFKAYNYEGLNFREDPHNSYGQKYGTLTYLHLLDPEDLPLRVAIFLIGKWSKSIGSGPVA